ncbi:MAG: M23 family metallopeptidase [Proteobacteria bacterium]|nr:M23 family metallopeptidase [Pseudomonadota bacterium]
MRKTSNAERSRPLFTALVLCASFAFASCSTTPRTELYWPGYDTTLPRQHTPSKRIAMRTHADRSRTRAASDRETPVPKVRPRYADNIVPVSGDQRFVWPVNGRIISNFGTNLQGETNDGINIAATLGEPIHAAATGTVTYAGNELRGYGNLVLIRHDDGYVTAYAHAESITVERGDRVLKGQVIGYAGDTGDVVRPQLHFEIRRGIEPVDPAPLLVAFRQT